MRGRRKRVKKKRQTRVSRSTKNRLASFFEPSLAPTLLVSALNVRPRMLGRALMVATAALRGSCSVCATAPARRAALAAARFRPRCVDKGGWACTRERRDMHSACGDTICGGTASRGGRFPWLAVAAVASTAAFDAENFAAAALLTPNISLSIPSLVTTAHTCSRPGSRRSHRWPRCPLK